MDMKEKWHSEIGSIGNVNVEEKFEATCLDCGSTKNIQMHAHRNGHGDMVGFIFLCVKCSGKADMITMEINGIREHKD